jgi:membrane associated rhomboid family serine protease
MFPIRDHNPSGRTPYVTYALIMANIAVFLGYWNTLASDHDLAVFFYVWGLVPERVLAGQGLPTLITHMFLHGGWLHLAGNMLFLWIFGDNLEDELGHGRFALFYLACGFGAAALQVAADPVSGAPMVGASGAIAGVLGGYLLLFPRARIDVLFIFVIFFRVFSIAAWVVLGVWFGLQLWSSASGATDGVAYLAHVGGFVAGVVLTLPALMRRGGRGYWAQNAGAPPHPETRYKITPTAIPRVPKR